MTSDDVIALFREAGALLDGHFCYASGRHGRHFLQASRVLQYPAHTEKLCQAIADLFRDAAIDLVVGPATGGIILAYETARALNCRAAFTEKDGQGGMAVKRGIAIKSGARILVVEDIITTGGSVQKTIDHLRSRGSKVIGVSVLIDRSNDAVTFDADYRPLARFTLESWPGEQCPLCATGAPLIEPDDIIV